MTNILNTMITNQPIKKPVKQEQMPAFTFSSEGRIRPMKDKGRLLPSKIFDSPIDIAKDLKNDIVSIGKAAKGKANDHELGRINDLAMKLGSLGLAGYLFVKNPFKLNKAMEFVGLGTFFGAMSLWPKLTIQAPVRARTGVDVHQKYIDSQGRKKMLYQDPQYVLTDLLSREDLDRIGKKSKVSENLPDRDNFIKQRAQKTALQANTLWMMTAGPASPLVSAVACNMLEKPINAAIEQVGISSSTKSLDKLQQALSVSKQNQANTIYSLTDDALNTFLSKHSDEVLDAKMIDTLSKKIASKLNAASLGDAVKAELKALNKQSTIDDEIIQSVLRNKNLLGLLDNLDDATRNALNEAVQKGSISSIANILSKANGGKKVAQEKFKREMVSALQTAVSEKSAVKIGDVAESIKGLSSTVNKLATDKKVLDKFIMARVGDQPGTYIANQWDKVCNALIKSLNLKGKDLKELSSGDMNKLISKLDDLAGKDKEFNEIINKLMKLIDDYDAKTSTDLFTGKVSTFIDDATTLASSRLNTQGFSTLADKVKTLNNTVNVNTAERVAGAKSSFYRLIQALDLFRDVNSSNSTFKQQLTTKLKQEGVNVTDDVITKLVEASKKLILVATPTDYVEKLQTLGFNFTEAEYKAVLGALFDSDADTKILSALEANMSKDKATRLVNGFRSYKSEFMSKVANWQNGMTPELSRRVVTGTTGSPNATERANLVGKPLKSLVTDAAKKTYNSQKWMKIFGGALGALTVATLLAGLAIGRKGDIEKQVEAESKVNG